MQIVWDPVKKKWANTDGDESEQDAFKPPPKMSELMPSPAMPSNANQVSNIPQPEPQPPSMMAPQNAAPMPAPNFSNPQNDQTATTPKVPSLQSNMFKMQRNKSKFDTHKKKEKEFLSKAIFSLCSSQKVIR